MGAGSVLEKGSLRFSLNGIRGFGFEGGHPETKGLHANGQIITVPLHNHEVSLDYLRLEAELEYAFRDSWVLVFRAPYDIKNQKAGVEFIEPATSEEKEAMLSNMNIHHRTEIYRGLSDLMLLASHNRRDLFREGDFLKISLGTTLPTGRTEENPFELGGHGLKHLHIQFGTGTFDPLLELSYRMPLKRQFSLGVYALSRLPFYENGKTYQGPAEITPGLILGYRLNSRISFHLNPTAHYQNFAYWEGQRDINSGLVATSVVLGMAIKAREDMTLAFDVRYPLSQRTLSEGDTFKQGPTFLFRISRDMFH